MSNDETAELHSDLKQLFITVAHMGVYLSGIGIVFVLISAWCVAYEVVAKFRGKTHGVSVFMGGGEVHKLGTFIAWEKKRNAAMWTGLGCITIGSLFQLVGLLVQNWWYPW